MTLRTERIRTLDQIRAFLDGSEPTDFRFAGRDSAYDFVRRTLVRFEFHGLKRDYVVVYDDSDLAAMLPVSGPPGSES